MTSKELYYEFQLVLNKNASLRNVDVSKGNFVILYNRELGSWLNSYIQKNSSTNRVIGIKELLSVDEKLVLSSKEADYYSYQLPDLFFDFVDSQSECEKGICKSMITNYLEKPKDVRSSITNYPPSFKFEEGLCNITKEKLNVFLGDFQINSTYLSYYQKPKKIDLQGYRKIDGSLSTNIDSDLPDIYQSEVINRTVIEVMRQFENVNGYKLSADREVV